MCAGGEVPLMPASIDTPTNLQLTIRNQPTAANITLGVAPSILPTHPPAHTGVVYKVGQSVY